MYLKAPKKKTKKYTETNGNLFQLYFLNIHFALHSVLILKGSLKGWKGGNGGGLSCMLSIYRTLIAYDTAFLYDC